MNKSLTMLGRGRRWTVAFLEPVGWSTRVSLRSAATSSFVARIRRQEQVKEDETICRQVLPSARYLLFCEGKPNLTRDNRNIAWATFDEAKSAAVGSRNDDGGSKELEGKVVFLGLSDDASATPLFAVPVAKGDNGRGLSNCNFTDMRVAMFSQENHAESNHLLTKAWSLLRWHRRSNFCGNCGQKVVRNFSGSQVSCPTCKSIEYPTLSPVGIVLVAAADNSKVLLIRQPRYPAGMYSCVAGFVDAGESISDCIRREVAEEVGLEVVGDVDVVTSQHWPFPAGNLMVGCLAHVDPLHQPDVDTKELEDARWFSPRELRAALERIEENPMLRVGTGNDSPNAFFVPPKEALAHHLITKWLTDNGH